MTPFGQRVRDLRRQRGMKLQELAGHLGVSSAYLSALEHGKRGRPTFALVQGIIHVFGIIWDEADELIRLAELSNPKITIDTSGLEPGATLLANRLAREIDRLMPEEIAAILAIVDRPGRDTPD